MEAGSGFKIGQRSKEKMGLEPHSYPALPNLNRKCYLMLYQKMSVRKIFASFLYRLFKYLELLEELFPR